MAKFYETNAYKCFEFGTHCKKIATVIRRMSKIFPDIKDDIEALKDGYELNNGGFNECDDTTTYGDKQTPTYRFIVDFDGEDYWYICMYYFKNSHVTSEHTEAEATSEQAEAEPTEANTIIKVYTNIKKLSDNYYELEYYALRNNEIVGHGFEDFTRERIKTAVKFYDVKLLTGDYVTTTTGVTRRKKETLACVVAVPVSVKKSDVLALVELEYGGNVEISKTYPHFCWYESFDSTIKKIIVHTVESVQPETETTVQKTQADMKNDINKKFGVNCVYYDTDSIMCDNTIQIVNTHKDYIVRAFKNEKELTVQCPYFPKREYAIDYINSLCDNGAVSRDVVFTINNSDIYDCFSDVNITGTTAQIKYATDTLNEFYKRLCNDIALEYKTRIYDDIDIESKDYYENLNIYVTTLKKVLKGNSAKAVITNHDKFDIWGNVYRTAMIFILAYNENKSDWLVRYLENKIRRELFPDVQILF